MKFMVTARPRPLPPPADLVRQAQSWLQAKLDDGSFEAVYAYPEGGGFSIGENDSHEQLMEQLMDYPLSPFVDFEVQPLVDMNPAFDRFIPFVEATNAQLAGQN
jgi:muconolactone delta-isomerase